MGDTRLLPIECGIHWKTPETRLESFLFQTGSQAELRDPSASASGVLGLQEGMPLALPPCGPVPACTHVHMCVHVRRPEVNLRSWREGVDGKVLTLSTGT